MHVDVAGHGDLPHLARLVWLNAAPDEQLTQSIESFAMDLGAWWATHRESHLAFLARAGGSASDSEVFGMAWLALVPRVPRPGLSTRQSADIQSVFVLPERRGNRIGSALIEAATEHALQVGVGRVTVHSGSRSVPVYERLGFTSSPQLLHRTGG